MISASSVHECLEIIDAALFEVAYDTKESKAPSVIDEETEEGTSSAAALLKETSSSSTVDQSNKRVFKNEGTQTEVETTAADPRTVVTQQEVQLHSSFGKARTSRYVNRVYNAILEYYLVDSTSLPLALRKHYTPSCPLVLNTTDTDHMGVTTEQKAILPAPEESISVTVQRTPSLGYSASTGTKSYDGISAVADKTSPDTTLVADVSNLPEQHSSMLSKHVEHVRAVMLESADEEEGKFRQKAANL